MPLSMFGRGKSWFGDDEEEPTPLFPPGVIGTDKQSMFPVKSDPSPVLGALKSGWKGIGDWLGGPMGGDTGGGEDGLMAYHPTSRGQMISQMLLGASKGMMAQRGRYANPLGGAILGAGEGMDAAREHDLELRKLAQEQQYKQAEMALKAVQARNEGLKAEHEGEYTIGRTRFGRDNKPLATAPPEEMSEYQKGELDVRRDELEHKGDITPYQQQELALRKIDQARRNDLTPYQKQQLDLESQRLGLSKEEAAQRQAAAAEAAKLDKSGPERDRTRMVGIAEDIRANRPVKPEDMAWYERVYRETAQQTNTFDPASGGTIIKQPDVTDIPPPPSMAGKPLPAPGITQVPTQYPSAQVEAAGTTYGAYKDFDTQAREVQELLKDMSPGERMSSDKAARIEAKLTPMIAAMAERGHTGVVNAGEAETYKERFGDLTGPGAAAKLMLGVDRAQAALDEGRKIMRSAARNKALTVGSAAEAKTIPKGTPFVLNGHVGVSLGDGKAQMLDED